MRFIHGIALVCILICSLGVVLFAQQSAVPAKPAEPKYSEVKYSANTYSYRWEGEDKILVLNGEVKFVQGDTTILADKVDYHESTRTAIANGNLKAFDPQSTITGNQCTINLKDKKAVVTGGVHITSKPKPKSAKPGESSSKSELKDAIEVTCESVEYFYKEKKAIVSTPVRIVQKNRVITADSATYFGKDDIIELVGNVKGQDEKDRHTFSAPKVRISLKDGKEWVEAEKASGTIYVKDEEESKAEAKPAVNKEEKPAAKTEEKPTEKHQ